jgi:protein phosphatase
MSDACTLRYAAISDTGLLRPGNEDAVFAGPGLIAVADGVGGSAAGEVASELAIGAVAPLDAQAPADPVEALRAAVDTANARIREAVEADPAKTGMGTTLTALLLANGSFGLAHAGDSRAYRLRDGDVAQITRDDTYVQWLVDEGCISEEEAGTHPHKSVVMRVLQGEPVEATYEEFDAVLGDRYLVCSDGLPAAVSDDVVAATLREEADVERCAARLIELALEGGAPDNVTVVVADVVPAEKPGILGRLLGL